MKNALLNMVRQIQEFIKTLGPTKRFSIIAACFIVVFGLGVVIYLVSGHDNVPLLTNIPADQVSTIVAKLNEKSVPFQLKDGGKTITVPQEFLHSTEMLLMSEIGSTKIGNIGLELFDKQDFGMSHLAQKVNFQRALQGELMRAVNTLTAVKQSKIILALPAKKTFLEDSAPATASVVVELHPGKTLSEDQVRGIQYLVANSVEGLAPEHVSVVDDRGKMLSRGADSVSSGSSEMMDLKHKVEKDMEDRIEAILTKVVGSTKVLARVDATLSNKISQSVEESVDPDKTAIKSQTTDSEVMDGARNNPTGVPGSRSNLPGADQNAATVGFKQNTNHETKTTNYDVPKTTRNVKEMAGNLERLSVAVVVDGLNQTTTSADGKTETKYVPRTPEELAKFEDLVKNAVGFNTARGDQVKIENMAFVSEDFSESDKILTGLERKKLLYSLMKWVLLALSLSLFFFVVIRPFMKWVTDSFQDTAEEMLPRTIEELEELQTSESSLPGMSGAMPILQESLDPDKAESELLKDRILGLMEADEEKASNAFGIWLSRKDP